MVTSVAATQSVRTRIVPVLALLSALMAPFFVTPSRLTLLTTLGITAIVVLGMIFVIGQTGLVSLGQAALTASGAYALAILVNETDAPWFVAVLVAAFAGGLVGSVVALPSLRVRGPYFAIVTIILGFSVPEVVNLGSEYSGGEFGIYVDQIMFGPLTAVASTYFVVAVLLAASMWFCANLQRSEFGRALRVVRTHPVAATAVGVNAFRLQTLGVTVGNVLAGLGGGLLALQVGGVTPDDFALQASTLYLVAAVVGGTHSVYGAVIGAAIVELVLNALASQSYYANIVLGVILVVSLAVLPDGVTGLFRALPRGMTHTARRLIPGRASEPREARSGD